MKRALALAGARRILSGGSGIRTHERGKPVSGFQDRCNQPLCHPSGLVGILPVFASRGNPAPLSRSRVSFPTSHGRVSSRGGSQADCLGGGYCFCLRQEACAMYETRFGLRRRPFRPTPDTDLYFPAARHQAALHRLRRALDDDEGLLLLTGDAGSGKTIVARRLLEGLDENVRCVLLTNSHVARNGDLLQAILFDLGLPYQGLTEQVARLAVTESCLDFYRDGGKTLICVDEAHYLHGDLLEELRLLSNLEGKAGKAVQILLIALAEIEKAIEKPSMLAFRQRLTVRARLEPIDANEAPDYLRHYVEVADGRPDRLFGEDVLDILTHAGNGNPRILNQAAHLAFSLADEAEQNTVDA